jgi:hypothetical protein
LYNVRLIKAEIPMCIKIPVKDLLPRSRSTSLPRFTSY